MEKSLPLLSVVIPCYNQGEYLPEILACFPDYHEQNTYEVIFVNDGSTDENTLTLLDNIESKGFQVLHQQNQGLCTTRNNGINISNGKYILPLDGDDRVSVQLIYEAIEILEENPKYSVVYCDGHYFNGEYFNAETGPWIIGEFNLQRLMIWNYIPSLAVFRKSAWKNANGYDTNLIGFEDWDLWLSIAFAGGNFFYINKILFEYRLTHNSLSRTITPEHYADLRDYLQEKHNSFLGRDHLNNDFVLRFKRNKRLWIKLFARVYFPTYFEKLVKNGKVNSINLE